MKKILMVTAMLTFALAASAQFYLGGSVGVSTNTVRFQGEHSTLATYGIVPEMGYNISNVFAVGVAVGVKYTVPGEEDDYTTWDVSPYFRTTFANVRSMKFFVDLSPCYQKYSNNTTDISADGFGFSVNPGFRVNLTDKLEFLGRTSIFSYQKLSRKGYKTTNTQFAIPSVAQLGLQYNF